MPEIKELLEHLMDCYQQQDLGEVGEEAVPSPLDELYAQFETQAEKLAACKGIEDFVRVGRQHFVDHPPQTHIMLAEGFGVQLAGGVEISLTPSVIEDLAGTMEPQPSFPVTEGRSIRGQNGIKPSEQYGVTGNKPSASLREPS